MNQQTSTNAINKTRTSKYTSSPQGSPASGDLGVYSSIQANTRTNLMKTTIKAIKELPQAMEVKRQAGLGGKLPRTPRWGRLPSSSTSLQRRDRWRFNLGQASPFDSRTLNRPILLLNDGENQPSKASSKLQAKSPFKVHKNPNL